MQSEVFPRTEWFAMSDDASYGDRIDRRRFLKLAGASGVAALAVGPASVGGQTTSRPTHVGVTYRAPDEIQWNMANSVDQADISRHALFDPLAKFNYARSEFDPALVTDWTFHAGGSGVDLSIRSDAVWDNGDPVTADDLARQLKLGLLAEESYADYVSTVQAVDDTTVEVGFVGTINPEIATFDLLENTVLFAHADTYQQFLDNDDASSYQMYADDDPIASGPWGLESRDSQTLSLGLNENHPDTDAIDYDYSFEYYTSNSETHEAMRTDGVDSVFSIFTPPKVVAEFPEHVEEVTFPAKFGFGLVPNHDHPDLGTQAVRQAIAYVVDRPNVVQNAGPRTKIPCSKPMGIPTHDQESRLGDALSDYDAYGPNDGEADSAAATAVLEKAGYTVGSTVKDSSGATVSFSLTVPQGWSDWVTAAETVVAQLDTFGFDVTLDTRSFSTLTGTVWPDGDFDLTAGSWLPGGASASFPYFPLHYQMVGPFWAWSYNYPAANGDRGGTNADVTVPSRTGNGTTTVNPTDRLQELSSTSDELLTREIVLEQAWVTNQDLPVIPVTENLEQSWLTSDEWALPTDVGAADAAKVKWPSTWLPRQGEMAYDGQTDTVTDTCGTEAPASTGDTTPRDLDGDGEYMDMNGNCRLDNDDVVTYFHVMNSDAVGNHASLYDYNGNDRVDFDDVVTLFESL